MKEKKTIKSIEVPGSWLYLLETETQLSQIKEILEEKGMEVEYWDLANVLEILYSEKGSIDMELADISRADEATRTYLTEHQIRTAFLVSFQPEDYDLVREVFLSVIAAVGGYFCGDTEDFQPEIRA